ncbi:MAG: hypothetical protein KC486_11345 [Myxococcales bacterium]|nr:hypothetical protein [Myxococcales bacterium]
MSLPQLLDRPSGLSIRAALGLLFALLFPRLSLTSPWFAVAFAGGWLLFVVARLLVLREPAALRFLRATPSGLALHVGEAVFVSLALAFLLLWLAGLGLVVVPMTAGIALVLGYFLFHAVVLWMLTSHFTGRVTEHGRSRPQLRRVLRIAAFLGEECVVVAALAVTEGARVEALSGPASVADLLAAPLLGLLLLGLCFTPIARLSQAASDETLALGEIALVHGAALFVLALTGSLPF